MMDDKSIESKAEQLAREAAARAARLALVDAEKAQAIAIARAVKDANIDRDLLEHSRHLAEINGSQRAMSQSLTDLKGSFERMEVANAAIATFVSKQRDRRFSTRAVLLSVAAGIAAYASLIAGIVFH